MSEIISISLSDSDFKYITELKNKGYGASAIMQDTLQILRKMDYLKKMNELNQQLANCIKDRNKNVL